MSLFKSLGSIVGKVGSAIAGPLSVVNPVYGGIAGALGTAFAKPASLMPGALPDPRRMQGGGGGGSFPGLGRLGPGAAGRMAGAAVGMGARYVGRVATSAARYCRQNPGWCATIGGVAAVEALINSGQLPVHKGRRGRGLTSREMRSFRKVHRVLSKFCAPRMRIRRAAACR